MATREELELRLDGIYLAALARFEGDDRVRETTITAQPRLGGDLEEISDLYLIDPAELTYAEICHRYAPGYYELEIIPDEGERVEIVFRVMTDIDSGELALFGAARWCPDVPVWVAQAIAAIDRSTEGALELALIEQIFTKSRDGRKKSSPIGRGIPSYDRGTVRSLTSQMYWINRDRIAS